MKGDHKNRYKNYLALVRKKNSIGQKQVAALLGHKNANLVSRLERGTRMPSFGTALKLSIIYHIPTRALFQDYYQACQREVRKHEQKMKGWKPVGGPNGHDKDMNAEFCTVEQKLKPRKVKGTDLDKGRTHIANLLTLRRKRMGH